MLEKFPSVLASQPGKTTLLNHHIPTTDCVPMRQGSYRIPLAYHNEVMKILDEMEKAGIIKKSDSPWAAPMVVVKKKNGKLRICIDYRKLNRVTQADAYPMPRISAFKKALTSSTVMRNLDPNLTFILQTDASNVGVGDVMSQGQDDKTIAYFSRKLPDHERNYSTVGKRMPGGDVRGQEL